MLNTSGWQTLKTKKLGPYAGNSSCIVTNHEAAKYCRETCFCVGHLGTWGSGVRAPLALYLEVGGILTDMHSATGFVADEFL